MIPDRKTSFAAHPWTDFKEGLAYIGRRQDLKILTLLLAIFRITVAPFFIVYLAANDKWFGGRPQTLVWLEVFFTLGMLVSALLMGKISVNRPLLWFANGLAVVGISVFAMAFSPVLWIFILWQVIAGLALPPADIPVATYLQLSIPDGFRGRVNSVRDMISSGVVPIGMIGGGLIVERVGLVHAFELMGLGMFGACLVGILSRPYREALMPLEPA